jgi:hypothetical protein
VKAGDFKDMMLWITEVTKAIDIGRAIAAAQEQTDDPKADFAVEEKGEAKAKKETANKVKDRKKVDEKQTRGTAKQNNNKKT